MLGALIKKTPLSPLLWYINHYLCLAKGLSQVLQGTGRPGIRSSKHPPNHFSNFPWLYQYFASVQKYFA